MSLSVTSTPKRNSTSVHSGDHDSPPVSQKELKDTMRPELNGQTWEFNFKRLAQALSAKTRKPSALPVNPEQVDTLKNYDVAIDKLQSQIDKAYENFACQKPAKSLVKKERPERKHYPGFIDFLNEGIKSSLAQLPKDHKALYRDLKFYVWDRPTKDGIEGAQPLKPDGAGVLGFEADELDNLFWSPPAEGGEQIAIPVEVKDNWSELLLQAATYARCMFSASPLRQFVLVIGYKHNEHSLRFLVFHRGGCTSSEPLDLDHPKGQEGFIHLLVSILTWRTRADAGFPAWCNDAQVCLPGRNAADRSPLIVDIDRILHYSVCVRGRAPRVFRIRVPAALPVEETLAGNLVPATQTGVRRSARIQAAKEKKISQTSGTGSPLNPTQFVSGNAKKNVSSDDDEEGKLSAHLFFPLYICFTVSSIAISRVRASADRVENVDQAIDWYPLDPLNLAPGDSAVLKLCWVRGRGPNNVFIEPLLLSNCSGLFGVPKHVYSFRAHHKAGCPTTNHLLVPAPSDKLEDFWWKLWDETSEPPERRSLLSHAIGFVGHSLVSAKDLPSLVLAVVHAHAGYYNMCVKNYQHRDLSIGNVLMVDEPIKTERFDIPTPNETQREILDLCRELGIDDQCTGFVIDGDMAVNWESYFTEEHVGTKSGTSEFMSSMLLNPLNKNHVHSPVDDYYSFYFLTQWACAFRDLSPEDKPEEPQHLQQLRMRLAGGLDSRDAATLTITGADLEPEVYGAFLVQAQPFLRKWYASLSTLTSEWRHIDASKRFNAKTFRDIADRGLLYFLRVAVDSKLFVTVRSQLSP
ncbi:hypothetical protein F5050DRAFT_1197572 [Lentinula boryana]|uniref:Fungal-type protein kinase domain-containing protein n=1 Tax=Lentinula boryana TaxID=40481 RepID=A0ABQ8PY97_9AGAR|nr:hypothetical protein F5050DRAFT_1197572 [Lentinula boryana]